MKKTLFTFILLSMIGVASFVACTKEDSVNPSNVTSTEMLSKKKRPVVSIDSTWIKCGMSSVNGVSTYPSVTLTNLRTYHRTGNINGTNSDILVIEFDSPVIAGKTVNCMYLRANNCTGRPDCSIINGVQSAQVTYCATVPKFEIVFGLSWLNPFNPSYTGVIHVTTTEGCIYQSQTFTFTPPTTL